MSGHGPERWLLGRAFVKAAILALVVFGGAPRLFRPPNDWIAYSGLALIGSLVLFVVLAWEERQESADEHLLRHRRRRP